MPKIYKKQMTWVQVATSNSSVKVTVTDKKGKTKVYNVKALWHSAKEKKYKMKFFDYTTQEIKESNINFIKLE